MRYSFYTEAKLDFERREQLGLNARLNTPPPGVFAKEFVFA